MESPYQTNYQAFSDWRTESYHAPEERHFYSLRSFAGEFLLAFIILAGMLMLVNPFQQVTFAPPIGASGWWALLGLVTLGGVYLRWRIIHHPALSDYACPHCQNRNLARIPRRFRHRLLGLAQIPAHRYLCSQCEWKGLRIDR